MILVKPSFKIEGIYGADLLLMEKAGRTCYKSEPKGDPEGFLKSKIKAKHLTIIEHSAMSVRFIADRGFTHELVRHRMAVYSQESTRWCNYAGKGIEIIHPEVLTHAQKERREDHFWTVQKLYEREIAEGLPPQIARGVLPTALKTEIVITTNFREWRLIFKQRALGTTGKPHPQMLELMVPLLAEVKTRVPAIFDDLIIKE